MTDTSKQALSLLKQIIAIPSVSGDEELLSRFLENWFRERNFSVNRVHNNIWMESVIDESLPRILLNSHMDTIRMVSDWKRDPYLAEEDEEHLYGLGCSDAGGALVSLIFSFIRLSQEKERNYNLVLLISAEEENSGPRGIQTALEKIGKIDLAIVGEPTDLEMAICERGLVVIDCISRGRSGHAAHQTGENAIYKALDDIQKIRQLKFDRHSKLLGDVQVEVTQIEAGYQHNVVPDECRFVLDVRTNELYSNEDIVDILKNTLEAEINPRSLRLKSSSINPDHPLVNRAREMGINTYGSKTMSDQALIPAPSVKIGPGKSEVSHQPDEFIVKNDITKAIDLYINLLKEFEI